MRRRESAISQQNPRRLFEIADVTPGGSLGDTRMGKDSKEAARDAALEDNEVMKGGPRSKVAQIAARPEPLKRIRRFGALGGRASGARICELSLKAVASGIRSWGNFCGITGRQHFSPSEGASLARSARFFDGRAFQQHLPHLEKACVFLARGL